MMPPPWRLMSETNTLKVHQQFLNICTLRRGMHMITSKQLHWK